MNFFKEFDRLNNKYSEPEQKEVALAYTKLFNGFLCQLKDIAQKPTKKST
jgi:hypothetical protein